jgi:predicted glutamine amidotransferase
MCRLFGQLADARGDAREPLCSAENALQVQSHRHPHGWGIAWYAARPGPPEIRRGVMAAHADADFTAAARTARSRLVVAHVRDASVGAVTLENTHPFAEGPWVLAHNGTVARFARVRAVREALERELGPARRRRLRGDTDSERLFQLFLARLAARAPGTRAGLWEVRQAMGDVVRRVREIADRGELRSTLNLLVSDGRLLAACRHGKPLHVALHAEGDVFAIASEPIGPGTWEPVPEDGFVGVDAARRVLRGRLP